MAVTFTWAGLKEQYRDLDQLPQDLTDAGQAMAQAAGDWVLGTVRPQYPYVSGHLRGGLNLKTTQRRKRHWVYVKVRSSAHHSHLYERGTKPRTDPTRKNAFRGQGTAHPVFVPAMVAARWQFERNIVAYMTRHGLTVKH